MYIRKNTHKLKNGEVRIGYGLLECRRVRGKPTQKTILNLGRDFKVPEPDWKDLTDRVAAILRGEPLLPLESEAVRTSAEDIARCLKAKGYDIHAPLDDRDLVITDEMRHIAIRSVGGERVGLYALEHLGFMDLLRELGFSETRVRIAAALVIGRMMSPGSEAHTYNWMLERSAILELLDLEMPCANSLYRVGDQLYAHREALMRGLFDQSQQLFSFEESILFYDLTNVYYHGKERGKLLRYGRSKEKRSNCPLVTLALDASGFPLRAEILEGNVSEPKTLKSALSRLNGRKVTVIMDAGITSAANLAWLKAQELDWICVERSKKPPIPTSKPDDELTTRSGTVVKAWILKDDETEKEEEEDAKEDEELRVHLWSKARKVTGDSILDKQRKKFESALDALHTGLSKPGHLKNYEKVLMKLGRLTERHKRVAHHYTVKVHRNGKNASSVRYTHALAHTEQTQASGGYVLRTSHTDWSAVQVARTYWRLTDIERTFRTLKSELGLRPLYHRKDDRIAGHLFISVLAYHAVHLIHSRLKMRGVHQSWTALRFVLDYWQRITTEMPQSKDRCIRVIRDTDPTPFQRYIASVMGINPNGFAQNIKDARPTKV